MTLSDTRTSLNKLSKEDLNKLIPFMVRQAHHERNQLHTVRPEPVEGLVQSFPNEVGSLATPNGNNGHRRTPIRHAVRQLLLVCAAMSAGAGAADPSTSVATPAAQVVDWQTSPLDLDLRGMNGERYSFACPSGKPQPSRVAGSGPYTDDSSICSAAVHAGTLRAKDGGEVTIEIRPGQNTYPGSEQNYIASASYNHAWSGGFVVIKTDANASRAPSN